MRDITSRKKSEALQAILIDQLTHRMVNMIATIGALATQSLRGASSLETFAATFTARLQSLTTTHKMLTRNAWRGALLSALIKTEFAPYEAEASQRWKATGEDIELEARHAVAFSMVLHELTTNAIKYGALSTDGGHIQISWQTVVVEGMSRLHLTWCESGGPAIEPPKRTGVGTRMLTDALASELDGTVTLIFERSGLRCEIDVPLKRGSLVS